MIVGVFQIQLDAGKPKLYLEDTDDHGRDVYKRQAMFTWEELFAFCMVIVAVVSLVFQMHDNK